MGLQVIVYAFPALLIGPGAGNPEKSLLLIPVFMPARTIRERMVILLSVLCVFLVCCTFIFFSCQYRILSEIRSVGSLDKV